MRPTIRKGNRFTVPKPLREKHGWAAGTLIEFRPNSDGSIALQVVESSSKAGQKTLASNRQQKS